MKFRITLAAALAVLSITLFASCSARKEAKVVAVEKGCRFRLVPISDEYALGVGAGMAMCGLFTKTESENLGNGCWQFTGMYRK
jgi:hypothetical protein